MSHCSFIVQALIIQQNHTETEQGIPTLLHNDIKQHTTQVQQEQYLAKYSVKKTSSSSFIIIIIVNISPLLYSHIITTLAYNHHSNPSAICLRHYNHTQTRFLFNQPIFPVLLMFRPGPWELETVLGVYFTDCMPFLTRN